MRTIKNVNAGSIFSTNGFGDVIVLKIEGHSKITVWFLEHPCDVIVSAGNLRKGNVRNPMKPTVANRGFIGIGPYKACLSKTVTRTYRVWYNMLSRVYLPIKEYDVRSYSEISVCPEWFNFQNFAKWYHDQIDKFENTDFIFELDKDLRIPGNKVYSPETCYILPEHVNTLFTDHAWKRGEFPLGVSRASKNRYRVRVNSFGKQINLGSHYSNIQSAQLAYWTKKIQIIREVAEFYYPYLPMELADRLINFDWSDALEYYGDEARIGDVDNYNEAVRKAVDSVT